MESKSVSRTTFGMIGVGIAAVVGVVILAINAPGTSDGVGDVQGREPGEATTPTVAPSDWDGVVPSHPKLAEVGPNGLLPSGKPPQFVFISFDGSGNLEWIDHWNKFARDTGSRVTYFLSGVYFLDRANKDLYVGPKHKPGQSDIGFGNQETMSTEQYITEWTNRLEAAKPLGIELGTHYNGHFCGKNGGNTWSAAEWKSEVDQFKSLAANATANNAFATQIPDVFRNQPLVGGRTPCLEGKLNDVLYPVLAEAGLTYDTSCSGTIDQWPSKINGIWCFPLKNIPISGTKKSNLSMDYNFYVSLAKAKAVSPDRAKEIEDAVYQSYRNYFEHNFNGTRSPVIIGHHMARWNDYAYMKALVRFADETCSQPEVVCGSGRDLAQYLDSLTPEQLNALSNPPKSSSTTNAPTTTAGDESAAIGN